MIKTNKEGFMVEVNDKNQEMICPFRGPIPIPGQLAGQIHYVNIPCTSQCPFFKIKDGKVVRECSSQSNHKLEIKK